MLNDEYDDKLEQYEKHLKKLHDDVGIGEFTEFVVKALGRTHLVDKIDIIINLDGSIKINVLAANILEYEQLAANVIIQALRECEKHQDNMAWKHFVESVDGKVQRKDQAGAWAIHPEYFVVLPSSTPFLTVAEKLKGDILLVLVEESGKLKRLITKSTIVKEKRDRGITGQLNLDPKQLPKAGDFGVEENEIVKFSETEPMKIIYERLFSPSLHKIKQVIVIFNDKSYGVISEKEAYKWEEGDQPS